MPVRTLLALILLLVACISLFLLLVATDTALSVWERLQHAPLWVQVGYTLLLVLVSSTVLYLVWRWLKPAKVKKTVSTPHNRESLEDDLVESAKEGVDISAALDEIHEQQRRKTSGQIFIALYGEVSTGKSSLVKALLPDAQTSQDPRAGTTQVINHHEWQAASGDRIIIADLPGFNFSDNDAALEEARRSHLVVFLCDSDLSRSETEHLMHLKTLEKPMILGLNKADHYSLSEQTEIIQRLSERTGLNKADITVIRAGGKEQIIRILADGSEEKTSRSREADIQPLRRLIQKHLDNNRELMASLQDTAVMLMASEKLESAKQSHRYEQGQALVSRYSKRAVVGALAAVAPGSDIVIQGMLGTKLIQGLSALYDVPVKEVEIDRFLTLAGGKIRQMTAIVLAMSGNALKAFPGLGTVTGGLIHAVAYGMIFDSLGRAVLETLHSRGEMRPYPAARKFEELLREDLQTRAIRFAKMAISEKRDKGDS